MTTGTWHPEVNGIDIGGGYLVASPETLQPWKNEAEALAWWETAEENPANQPEPVADTTEETAEAEDTRKAITVTEINGTVRKPEDIAVQDVVRITAVEDTDITLKGTLDIDDEAFIVPFRQDGGPLVYFNAQVKDGEFSATLNFRDSGRYEVNTDLLNAELATPRFTSKPLVVYVMRQTASVS
ncbi:hypothetical protein VA7868_03744 [Vibrio aerogenes CECT 7868]|uniref:Uncharacterized protein n=1 Tax=Vibrio aerogenes CECT 7868 TaxID=1216006 RepID=A0A1M6B940_9VIBR|nr:hypothetical protein [Vibrio aerogenes]SHI45235.1 hypothetical protein VA7868_03744 [Vibrio aerogenes CECT 7868]